MDNLSLIAAIGNYFELGLDNHLIWKIPEDLAFYKKMTMGKNTIMGRKTFESMPSVALKGRNPIILSSHTLDNVCDVITFDDFYKLIDYVKKTNDFKRELMKHLLFHFFLCLQDIQEFIMFMKKLIKLLVLCL